MMIPFLVRISGALGLIDIPDEARKSHSQSISRAGGIAIFSAAYLGLFLSSVDASPITGLLCAGAIIFIFGLMDDRWNLHYLWKFSGQLIAALLIVDAGILIQNVPFLDKILMPNWAAIPLTVFFVVGVTNAINLSDGLDGLAGGSALLSLGLIALLAYVIDEHVYAIFAVAIMGAIAGFLRYNTYPATIFMGDSGSQFIGFSAACLAIMVTQSKSSEYGSILPVLILGLPILDTAYVMLVRIRSGKSPFQADSSHLHHRLVRLGFYHSEAVAAYYCFQIILLGLAYLFRFRPEIVLVSVYILFCVSLMVMLITAKRLQARSLSASRQPDSPTMDQNLRLKSGLRDDSTKPFDDRERRNSLFRWIGTHFSPLTRTLSFCLIIVIAAAFTSVVHISVDAPTESITSAITLLLLAIYIVAFNKGQHQSAWLLRLICSSAAAILMYHASLVELTSGWRYLLDSTLLASLLFLALCIKISRKSVFTLTTQDLLIVLILLSIQVLPIAESAQYLTMRITIFIFIVEYIIAVESAEHTLLNLSCICGLLALVLI